MGFGKDGKGAIIREAHEESAIATIVAHGIHKITSPIGTNLGEDFRILKSEIVATASGLDSGEGIELVFGICNNNLAEADIEECLEIDGPLFPNHRTDQEAAERWVKVLGAGRQEPTLTSIRFIGKGGGDIIISKDPWTYDNGYGWGWFVYNMAGQSVVGPFNVSILATHYGVWIK